ncbi:hypothetical protein GLOIN_2v229933 [Rhizophagus irregularis DAOM 181602=DAOM 197198]|nr:hypothetical protein GLOIN_2v229933 [Rhizophagus irregularis DAOM 181602=DAOM 197198]
MSEANTLLLPLLPLEKTRLRTGLGGGEGVLLYMRKKFLTLKTRTRRTWSRIEELEKGLDTFSKNIELHWRCKGLSIDSTSWYKDVKKLEDIVNRDRQKRCICQDNEDNGISLLEVWYDEKPEIVIPKRIQKIKEFVCLASKRFDQ